MLCFFHMKDGVFMQDCQHETTNKPNQVKSNTKTETRIMVPPTWLFTIFCLIMTVGMSNSQMKAMPMLCQSHAAQQIFQLPEMFNCTFSLQDDQPAPYNATLQLYRVVKQHHEIQN